MTFITGKVIFPQHMEEVNEDKLNSSLETITGARVGAVC
jgi:hypothetical protein